MELAYCERWNNLTGAPLKALTPDEARRRHESGKLYSAVFHTGEALPYAVVEVRLETAYVGVRFFDGHSKDRLFHSYIAEGKEMFLSQFAVRAWADDLELDWAYTFYFNEDSTFHVERRLRGRDHDEATDGIIHSSTLGELWVPVPEFGDYEYLLDEGRPRVLPGDVPASDVNTFLSQPGAQLFG